MGVGLALGAGLILLIWLTTGEAPHPGVSILIGICMGVIVNTCWPERDG